MAPGYNYQPLQQNDAANSYFQPRQSDPATPSPAYVTAPASPGVLEMAAPVPSSSSVSAEPLNKNAIAIVSKEESNQSVQEEEEKSKKSASKEKHARPPLKLQKQQQHLVDFNAMEQKYRCCGCVSIKKGVMAIGIFELVFVLLQFGIHFAVYNFGYGKDFDPKLPPFEIYLNIVISGLTLLSLVFLFSALKTQNGFLFLPWQMVSVFQMIFFIFLGFCCVFQFFATSDRILQGQSTGINVAVLLGVLVLIAAAIGCLIWWNAMVQKCKKWFIQKKRGLPMQVADM